MNRTQLQPNDRPGIRSSFFLLNLVLLALAIAIFLTNEYLIKTYTTNNFVHGHLNDILIIWVYIPFLNVLLSCLPYFRRFQIKSLLACTLLTLLTGIVWEYLIPLFFANGTSDPIDLLMYLLGGITIWLILRTLANPRR